MTSRESYNNLPTWLRDAREQASFQDISVIAVGNKRDLKEEREVSFLEASQFAQEQGILFLETSALTGENVQEVFSTLAQRILNKVEASMSREGEVGVALILNKVGASSMSREGEVGVGVCREAEYGSGVGRRWGDIRWRGGGCQGYGRIGREVVHSKGVCEKDF